MMKRERVQMKDSCCPSIKPANAESIFAPRPFAPKVEEHEVPAAGPGIDFNFADISILPRETVQPKLVLGPVGDRYEQEADRVARRVVETISSSDRESVQRQDAEEEELDLEEELEEEEELRRKVDVSSAAGGADVGPDLESDIWGARSEGQPLSDGVLLPMERAFGADFGGVRVHADDQADKLNQSIQARAFTTGRDIFLRRGEFWQGSRGGLELIAHELTHVLQQNVGELQRTKIVRRKSRVKDAVASVKSSGGEGRIQRTFAGDREMADKFTAINYSLIPGAKDTPFFDLFTQLNKCEGIVYLQQGPQAVFNQENKILQLSIQSIKQIEEYVDKIKKDQNLEPGDTATVISDLSKIAHEMSHARDYVMIEGITRNQSDPVMYSELKAWSHEAVTALKLSKASGNERIIDETTQSLIEGWENVNPLKIKDTYDERKSNELLRRFWTYIARKKQGGEVTKETLKQIVEQNEKWYVDQLTKLKNYVSKAKSHE